MQNLRVWQSADSTYVLRYAKSMKGIFDDSDRAIQPSRFDAKTFYRSAGRCLERYGGLLKFWYYRNLLSR